MKTPPIREIQVGAVGEQRLNPDQVKIVVVIANQKESVEEVKSSVTRREEYVLQVHTESSIVVLALIAKKNQKLGSTLYINNPCWNSTWINNSTSLTISFQKPSGNQESRSERGQSCRIQVVNKV